jgi:microcystin-dependent protein
VLFQLLGTTYGGDGAITFVTPAVPSPIANYAYRTATFGLFPPG